MQLGGNRPEKNAAVAVRRPKRTRGHVRHPFDHFVRLAQLTANARGAREVKLHVVVGVITDRVSRAHDVPRERRKPPHVIAHHEERRRDTLILERLENRGSRALVRTVIESQVDPRGALPWPSLHRGPEDQVHPHHSVPRLYTASTRSATTGH